LPHACAAGTPLAAAMHAAARQTFPSTYSADPGPGCSSLFDVDVKPLPLAATRPGVVIRSVHVKEIAAAQLQAMVGGSRCALELG
jgi:hypothetical protein